MNISIEKFADGKLWFQMPIDWTQWYEKKEESFYVLGGTLKQVSLIYADKNILDRAAYVEKFIFFNIERDIKQPFQNYISKNGVKYSSTFYGDYSVMTDETFYKYIISVPLNDWDIAYFVFSDIQKGDFNKQLVTTTLEQDVAFFLDSLQYNE